MDTMSNNDTRGWIMCVVSGIACVFGASIICVDVIIRQFPGKKDFRIQDSNVFLASSLSLSFGVMLFSALYSMLPSSKTYLVKSGFSPSTAAWILLGCFMGGFAGIQVVSRFLHRHIPSHVVDCDHTHAETSNSRSHSHARHRSRGQSHAKKPAGGVNGDATESTALIPPANCVSPRLFVHPVLPVRADSRLLRPRTQRDLTYDRRHSMTQVQNRVMSFMADTKSNCDSSGPCYGYTDPCGQECFKHIGPRASEGFRQSIFSRTASGTLSHRSFYTVPATLDEEDRNDELATGSASAPSGLTRSRSRELADKACDPDDEDIEAQHHHHVPENAFMSIGLQTSIAIALHKLPEGFITYATNHANPHLGLSVFMALFVHNITEGFALALPLFLALGSRFRAMLWASLLGGASQPLGAGIAAAWFKIAGHYTDTPSSSVYGCMFAVTAGIMTSVALQLFVESLSLNHNRNLCIAFGFIGMAIMGASNALTSE